MFRSKLRYYHGTSEKRWQKISADKKFVPSDVKKVGDYWITKGAYFVCENPFIALWYAHVTSLQDKGSKPIVIRIDYEIGSSNLSKFINLLTADGHKLLAVAHNLYRQKLQLDILEKVLPKHENLDSYALELLMSKSTKLRGVIACFQEGVSFQSQISAHDYTNKYVTYQKGISPGDHVEICFYPELGLEKLDVFPMYKDDILKDLDVECNIWDLVCNGLTEPLENNEFKKKLLNYLHGEK